MKENNTQDTSTDVPLSDTQQNERVEPVAVITYPPVHLGYDIAYKTRLSGKLKVAEIVQNIFVVMVTRLVSFPGNFINIFINYLLGISVSGICISGLILFLHSSGVTDHYLRDCNNLCIGLEFTYCFLWMIHYFMVPSLILAFAYSSDLSDDIIYTRSNEKNLIFMVVIAYVSTIVYIWDLWATLKLLRKQRKKSDINLDLNATSTIVS